jgi:hypothetical protein
MNIKSAAFLALIGTILTTVLLVYNLVSAILNVTQGLVPAVTIFPLLIYSFASVTLAVFFFICHRQQS